jgi:adenine-specific DNA-methyltransferase
MQKLDPKTDGASPDVVEDNIETMRELFPDAFTEGSDPGGPRWKVDFDVLRELLGDQIEQRDERYGLTWHGKANARRIAQTPSTGTLRPCPEKSVDWDETENLFIEGDNLEVLKLLQKPYHKQVKMIYIDPPYNTGGDFIYPDRYKDNVSTYLEYTGQVDDKGNAFAANPEASGRYHTNWLTMMLPRLKLARTLLKNDGVIAISIDDTEVHNLIAMCNEVFGEENHIATVVWQKRYVSNVTAKWLSDMHDFIVIYGKSAESVYVNKWPKSETQLGAYRNPDNDPRGSWRPQDLSASRPYRAGQFTITGPTGRTFDPPPNRYWRCNKEQFDRWDQDGRIWWGINKDARPMLKAFLSESDGGTTPHTWWDYSFAGHNKEATLHLKQLFGGDSPFDTPKPVKLMEKLLELFCGGNDLILDFFAGSAPMAEAVLKSNAERSMHNRFMMVQLPERISRNDYGDIASIARKRIALAADKYRSGSKEGDHGELEGGDFGFRSFKLDSSNIVPWDPERRDIAQSLFESVDNIKMGRSEQEVLYELLLKYGLDLTVAVEERQIAGRSVYVVGGGALIACLDDRIDLDVVQAIAKLKYDLAPEIVRVVFKDAGFPDDVVKTNTVQILQQAGIDDVRSL